VNPTRRQELDAVGKAGEAADRDSAYDEAQVSAAMKKPEISLKVTLRLGRGRDRCSARISDRDIRKTKNPERMPIDPIRMRSGIDRPT